jgi:hypothetical protein
VKHYAELTSSQYNQAKNTPGAAFIGNKNSPTKYVMASRKPIGVGTSKTRDEAKALIDSWQSTLKATLEP